MTTTRTLSEIKDTLTKHFGAPVTPDALAAHGGTKTVKEARLVGVLIAKRAGHKNEDIAHAFGYANDKTASAAFSKATKAFDENPQFTADARAVAASLSMHLSR
jgi:hypothetical protein